MNIRLLLEHAETLKKIQSLEDQIEELKKTLPSELAYLNNGKREFSSKKGRSTRSATQLKDDSVFVAGREAAYAKVFKRSDMKKHLSMEPYAGKSQHNTESDISNSLRRLVDSGRLQNVDGKAGYYKIVK